MNRIILRAALLLGMAFVWSAPRAAAADGKAIFLAQKCDTCHSMSTQAIEATTKSEKMKGPDLVDVVQAHEKSWIADYLHKKVEVEGKKHAKEFKGTD